MTPEAKEKMDQYIAKAMLLGMVYDPRDHTFNRYRVTNLHHNGRAIEAMVNAEYMEDASVTENSKLQPIPLWLEQIPYRERLQIWEKLYEAHMLP